MDTTTQLKQLQTQIDQLSAEFYRNNFSANQTFNKTSIFTTVLQVPVYATKPSTCEIGQIVSNGGKLWHCSATNTWTAQT